MRGDSMKKIVVMCFLIMACSAASHAEENMLLSYQSFIDYINSGQVQHVTIGDFDMKDIQVTILKDGKEQTYFVDRPYKAGEDPLLISLLRAKAISYEVLESDHSTGSMWKNILPAFGIFALPTLFIIVLVILGFVILNKVSHIERMLERSKGGNIEQG